VREEAARDEAVVRAAAEAARVEAEARARADARELERRHEMQLELARRKRNAASRSRAREAGLAALVGALIAGGAATAVHYGLVVPREQARATEDAAAIASRDTTLAEGQARAETTEARVRTLEDELAAAGVENAQLRKEADALRKATASDPPAQRWTGPARADIPTLNGFTSCAPGSKDPMCLR
jgi:hypothetical protein